MLQKLKRKLIIALIGKDSYMVNVVVTDDYVTAKQPSRHMFLQNCVFTSNRQLNMGVR